MQEHMWFAAAVQLAGGNFLRDDTVITSDCINFVFSLLSLSPFLFFFHAYCKFFGPKI